MLLYGRLYQKVTDDRWMQTSELPELFNEISISDTNDQIVVAERMLNWATDFIKPIQLLQIERLLAPDLIIIVASFTNPEGRDGRLVLWGKSDVTLIRKGDQSYWDDVKAAAEL